MTNANGRGFSYACAALLVAVLIAAAAIAPGDSAAAGGKRQAPCTKSALTGGLSRGGTPVPSGKLNGPFGCAGEFAYAAVIDHDIEVTVLFRAHGRNWATASRTKYCRNHSVPRRIYKPACETN